MRILTIDPGLNGGLCLMVEGKVFYASKFPQATVNGKKTIDLSHLAEMMKDILSIKTTVYLEKVHSMPKQGVASMFTFGRYFGQLEGLLAALGANVAQITPRDWHKIMASKFGDELHNVEGTAKERVKHLILEVLDPLPPCLLKKNGKPVEALFDAVAMGLCLS